MNQSQFHFYLDLSLCVEKVEESKVSETNLSSSLHNTVRTEMSQQNPFQTFLKSFENFAQCIQTHLSQFVGHAHSGNARQNPRTPLFSLSSKPIIPITSDGGSKQEAPIFLQEVIFFLFVS